jgi:type I restriction enzyme S subunit
MFDEEIISWSVDGGGYFFHRPKHKFSITNVSGFIRLHSNAWNYKFLYYLLDYQHQFMAFDYQTKAHPSVIKFLYYLVPLPIEEQTKIAEILSCIDTAIEQTEAMIAKQQRIKTGLMQDLLSKGIDEHGNIRTEHTHAFKDSPLGRIPEEWESICTREVCQLITKGSTPKARGVEGGECVVPFLRVQNLTFDGHIDFCADLEYIKLNVHLGELKRSVVLPDDVLQNIVGPPLGKISIVPSLYPEYNVNQAIAIFRPNHRVKSEYLCKWFSTPFARTWFDLNSKRTSGQQNLTLELCQNLPLALPDTKEQLRICHSIEVLENVDKQNKSTLLLLSRLKTGLMQDLLSGKVRVNQLIQ